MQCHVAVFHLKRLSVHSNDNVQNLQIITEKKCFFLASIIPFILQQINTDIMLKVTCHSKEQWMWIPALQKGFERFLKLILKHITYSLRILTAYKLSTWYHIIVYKNPTLTIIFSILN